MNRQGVSFIFCKAGNVRCYCYTLRQWNMFASHFSSDPAYHLRIPHGMLLKKSDNMTWHDSCEKSLWKLRHIDSRCAKKRCSRLQRQKNVARATRRCKNQNTGQRQSIKWKESGGASNDRETNGLATRMLAGIHLSHERSTEHC